MNGPSKNRDEIIVMRIVSLRLAVGLLGERDNAGWWVCGFMSPTSAAFLVPVFGSRVLQARYQGVLDAARRVHDERIGLGRAFHPFRLSEAVEQRVHEAVQAAGQELAESVCSPDAAKSTLARLAGTPVEAKGGPTLLGAVDMLDRPEWTARAASLYSSAFATGVECFPYFRDAR
jgi:hypothetical protein